MLAVQRAEMNQLGTLEHHYSDPSQPFGYAFGSSDEPAPAPEAPAAGEPLLNDLELNGANQFFERFQNDTSLFDDPKIFDTFDAFSQEPLPSFQGVSSSLGHPLLDSTSPIHTLDFASFGAGNLVSRFGQTQLSSPISSDFPNSQALNHSSQLAYPTAPSNPTKPARTQPDLFGTQDLFPIPKQARSRSSFSHHQSIPTVRHEKLDLGERQVGHPKHGAAPFEAARALGAEAVVRQRRAMPEVSFGSDADFGAQKYVAPGSALKDLKSCEAKFQSILETFESKWAGAASHQGATAKRRLSGPQSADLRHGFRPGQDAKDEEEGKSVKKAKRSRKGDDDEMSDGSEDRAGPKGKSKAKMRTFSEGNMGASGRRKSTLSEAKAPRQNLTEEEKKLNHIRSEQKRRNQIKEGFASLTEMMPDKTIGSSKCAILSSAVDWLSDLIEGNEQLRAQLAKLGG